MEDVKHSAQSNLVPLIAAALSFVYHLSLAIFANYVPLDRAGAAATLWAYSWTASIVGYFGLLAIVTKRSLLTTLFAYLLLLDAVFSAVWRFAFLQYILHNIYHDRCDGRRYSKPGDGCGVRFGLLHALTAAVLCLVTLCELLLANAVRRYACGLRKRAFEDVDGMDAEAVQVVHVMVAKGDAKT